MRRNHRKLTHCWHIGGSLLLLFTNGNKRGSACKPVQSIEFCTSTSFAAAYFGAILEIGVGSILFCSLPLTLSFSLFFSCGADSLAFVKYAEARH